MINGSDPVRTCYDCSNPVAALGLCKSHHGSWRRSITRGYKYSGTQPDAPKRSSVTDLEGFLRRLEANARICPETGCWVWGGGLSHGYGAMRFRGKNTPIHVLTYTFYVGPIPEGLELDHLCRNPSCCNPFHLEAVTRAENMRRGLLGVLRPPKTHCRYGHLLTEANLYLYRGERCCRVCIRDRNRRYRERHRSQKS